MAGAEMGGMGASMGVMGGGMGGGTSAMPTAPLLSDLFETETKPIATPATAPLPTTAPARAPPLASSSGGGGGGGGGAVDSDDPFAGLFSGIAPPPATSPSVPRRVSLDRPASSSSGTGGLDPNLEGRADLIAPTKFGSEMVVSRSEEAHTITCVEQMAPAAQVPTYLPKPFATACMCSPRRVLFPTGGHPNAPKGVSGSQVWQAGQASLGATYCMLIACLIAC